MRMLILVSILLTGCATTNNYALYIDSHKSISKDSTVSEIACYNTITETMKFGDNDVKKVAIQLIAQCKKDKSNIQPPKQGLLN
jgi:hypothetical protein